MTSGMPIGQALPGGHEVRWPFGQSLDEDAIVQVDSREGIGEVEPDPVVPTSARNARRYARGHDVVLEPGDRTLATLTGLGWIRPVFGRQSPVDTGGAPRQDRGMASSGEAALPSRVKQLVDLTTGSMTSVNRLISLALNELPDSAILVFDTDMRFVLTRGAAIGDNLMDPSDLEGRLAAEAMPPQRWDLYRPMYEAALRGEEGEREVPSPDGTRTYLIRVEPVADTNGTILGGILIATEITDLREAQRQALASERRFALAMKVAPIGMAVVSLDREFVEVNRSLCQMLAAEPRDLIGESLSRVIHPDDEDADLQLRAAVLAGESEGITCEKRLRTLDGRQLWVQHSVGLVRDGDGSPVHYVSQFADVTEAYESKKRLERLATRDQLTQLLNRGSLDRAASPLFGATGAGVAVLFIDLDGFKRVNDTLGHTAGDHVLKVVADRLAHRLRPTDLIARYGGDEFVVVIPNSGAEQGAAVAQHLHDALAAPVRVDGHDVRVGLSIGVALSEGGETFEQVLRRADRYLYQAKAAGGFCTVPDDSDAA
jgi:diguanylate cyclase (GGDEF)-like protein/PAS domain S-box-containing protein